MGGQEVAAGSTFLLEQADVVLEAFPDETIAVHLGTGRYFSIDLIGAETVELVATGNEVGAIVTHLATRYDADPAVVEGAVTDFVGRLLDEGLLRASPEGHSSAPLPEPERAAVAFSAPTLSVYSDMEDLLLLDPIHDVDETGWPTRADVPDGNAGRAAHRGMTVGEDARARVANPVAEKFFDAAIDAFGRAGAQAGIREHDLVIAGARIRLRFAGPALEPRLLPALEHARTETGGDDVDLTVLVFDTFTTGVQMPRPPWGPNDYGPKGSIVGFNDDRFRTAFMPGVDVLNMYDAARRTGLYWVATPSIVPWWETPLRTMVHWWAAPTTLQPLHGGAVGRDGVGVLVVGNSGAGKSSTTLACLEAGMEYVGDDYVVVDVASATAYSLYSTAKLEPDNLGRFPELAPLVSNADRLATQKAIVFLNDHRADRVVSSLQLRAIVLPHVTGLPDSSLGPGSPAEALRILAPTTSFHLPGYARQVVEKLGTLVRSLPCYRLHAGTNREQLTATVASLVEP